MTLAKNVSVKEPLKFSSCKLLISGSNTSTDHRVKTKFGNFNHLMLLMSVKKDTESCLTFYLVSIPGKEKVLDV